jgi:uncharacterized membrane protein
MLTFFYEWNTKTINYCSIFFEEIQILMEKSENGDIEREREREREREWFVAERQNRVAAKDFILIALRFLSKLSGTTKIQKLSFVTDTATAGHSLYPIKQ